MWNLCIYFAILLLLLLLYDKEKPLTFETKVLEIVIVPPVRICAYDDEVPTYFRLKANRNTTLMKY